MAIKLYKNRILSPVHLYIMTNFKKVSVSYQSSILFELLKEDLEYLPKYQEFKRFVRTERSLMQIHSKMNHIGKSNIASQLLLKHSISGQASTENLKDKSLAMHSSSTLSIVVGPRFNYYIFSMNSNNDQNN